MKKILSFLSFCSVLFLFLSPVWCQDKDVVFMIDNSGSMSVQVDQLRFIPSSIRELIRELSKDPEKRFWRVGLVRFEAESRTRILLPLTPVSDLGDETRVYPLLDNALQQFDYHGKWTNFASGLEKVSECLETSDSEKVVVIISDGKPEGDQNHDWIYKNGKKWYDRNNFTEAIRAFQGLSQESPTVHSLLVTKNPFNGLVSRFISSTGGREERAPKASKFRRGLFRLLKIPPPTECIAPSVANPSIGFLWAGTSDYLTPWDILSSLPLSPHPDEKLVVNYRTVNIRHRRIISNDPVASKIPFVMEEHIALNPGQYTYPEELPRLVSELFRQCEHDYFVLFSFVDDYSIQAHFFSRGQEMPFDHIHIATANLDKIKTQFGRAFESVERARFEKDFPVAYCDISVHVRTNDSHNNLIAPSVKLKVYVGNNLECETFTDADGNGFLRIPRVLGNSRLIIGPDEGREYAYFEINDAFWNESIQELQIPEISLAPDPMTNYYTRPVRFKFEGPDGTVYNIQKMWVDSGSGPQSMINERSLSGLRGSTRELEFSRPDPSGVPDEISRYMIRSWTYKMSFSSGMYWDAKVPFNWPMYFEDHINQMESAQIVDVVRRVLNDKDYVKNVKGVFRMVEEADHVNVIPRPEKLQMWQVLEGTGFPYPPPEGSSWGNDPDKLKTYKHLICDYGLEQYRHSAAIVLNRLLGGGYFNVHDIAPYKCLR